MGVVSKSHDVRLLINYTRNTLSIVLVEVIIRVQTKTKHEQKKKHLEYIELENEFNAKFNNIKL